MTERSYNIYGQSIFGEKNFKRGMVYTALKLNQRNTLPHTSIPLYIHTELYCKCRVKKGKRRRCISTQNQFVNQCSTFYVMLDSSMTLTAYYIYYTVLALR